MMSRWHFYLVRAPKAEQFLNVKKINVERWLENIVNSSVDIAKIILASEKQKMPDTYSKILSSLGGLAGFDEQTAIILSEFAKFRNLLAHEYFDIRFSKIRNFLNNVEEIYPKLINFAKEKLKTQRPS